MPRQIRITFTPAQLRAEAREAIQKHQASRRVKVAFAALTRAATSERFFYSNAQMSGLAKGLEEGIELAEKADAAERELAASP